MGEGLGRRGIIGILIGGHPSGGKSGNQTGSERAAWVGVVSRQNRTPGKNGIERDGGGKRGQAAVPLMRRLGLQSPVTAYRQNQIRPILLTPWFKP